MLNKIWRWIVDRLRRDFIAGLLVFVPVGVTVMGVFWLIDTLDDLVLPRIFKPLGLEGCGEVPPHGTSSAGWDFAGAGSRSSPPFCRPLADEGAGSP